MANKTSGDLETVEAAAGALSPIPPVVDQSDPKPQEEVKSGNPVSIVINRLIIVCEVIIGIVLILTPGASVSSTTLLWSNVCRCRPHWGWHHMWDCQWYSLPAHGHLVRSTSQ
jgi:hypothetical protein